MTDAGSPLPNSTPGPDPVGLAFGALGFGMALGVALLSVVMWGIRTSQAGAPPPAAAAAPSDRAFLAIVLGTLVGVSAAGIATWSLLAPIRNPWRQTMLAIVATFASFVIAAVVTIPVDRTFGRSGLLGLAVIAGLVCFWIGRRLGKAGRAP